MRKSLILFFLLATGFLPVIVSAYDSSNTHSEFISELVREWNKTNSRKITAEEQRWLEEGARLEDKPEWRTLNHFYDPINNRGLELLPGWQTGESSLQWGQDSLGQSNLVFGADNSWANALALYRERRKKEAFKALGGALHLLADAGLPAHVRNDDHVDGDPYEAWVKTEMANNNQMFSDFSYSKKNCLGYADCLRKMALTTNYNFFSRDTLNDISYREPYDRATVDKIGLVRVNGRIVAKASEDNDWYLDNDIHLLYWRELAPQIVGYNLAVIDNFFQEADKIDQADKTGKKTGVRIDGGEKITAESSTPPLIDESVGIPLSYLYSGPDGMGYGIVFSSSKPISTAVENNTLYNDNSEVLPESDLGGADVNEVEVIDSGATDDNQPDDIDTINEDATGTEDENLTDGEEVATGTDEGSTDNTDSNAGGSGASGGDGGGINPEPTCSGYNNLSPNLVHLWHFDDYQVYDSGFKTSDSAGSIAVKCYSYQSAGYWSNAITVSGSINNNCGTMLYGEEVPAGPFSLGFYAKNLGGQVHISLSQPSNTFFTLHSSLWNSLGYRQNSDNIWTGPETYLASEIPQDGAWHQIVLVFKPDRLEYYFDGALEEMELGDFSSNDVIQSINFIPEGGEFSFDEIALWSRVLSAEEIAAWYQANQPLCK